MKPTDLNTLHKAQSITKKKEKSKIKEGIQYSALNTGFNIKVICNM